MITSAIRDLGIARVGGRCEYCLLPQAGYQASFNIDHIVATQHGGQDLPDNLALCCPRCTRKKGPNLSGIDPATGIIVTLFHPRREHWAEHFRWSGPLAVGLTPCGRATVALLEMNHEDRVRLRQALMQESIF